MTAIIVRTDCAFNRNLNLNCSACNEGTALTCGEAEPVPRPPLALAAAGVWVLILPLVGASAETTSHNPIADLGVSLICEHPTAPALLNESRSDTCRGGSRA